MLNFRNLYGKKNICIAIITCIFSFYIFFNIDIGKTNATDTNCTQILIPVDGYSQQAIDIRNKCLGPNISSLTETNKENSSITFKITWSQPQSGENFNGEMLNGTKNIAYKFKKYQLWYSTPEGSGSIDLPNNFSNLSYEYKTNTQNTGGNFTFKIATWYEKNTIMVGAPSGIGAYGDPKSNQSTSIDAPKLNGSGKYDSNSQKATAHLNWFMNSSSKPNYYKLYKWRDSSTNVSEYKTFKNNETEYDDVVFNGKLDPNTSYVVNYTIEATYQGLTNQTANSNAISITFTSDANGNVSINQSTQDSPSTTFLHNTNTNNWTENTTSSGVCEKTFCSNRSNTIETYVCTAICWVSDGIYGVLSSTFEIFKGANSLNSTSPYTPNIQSVIGGSTTDSAASTGSATSATPSANAAANAASGINTNSSNAGSSAGSAATNNTGSVTIEGE